ncbi:MAG: transcriptional repressor [Chloroflexi bacterium]|nr:transcriptional repressor [Chloroflexota bacterium]
MQLQLFAFNGAHLRFGVESTPLYFLKGTAMRASSVNTAILELLGQEHTHLTAQAIYENIRERLPAVNPSTVYRALERLTHAGKISVSDMGSGAAVFELVSNKPHHHLVCQNCGKTMVLPHQSVAPYFDAIQAATGYKIYTNHLILFGCCPDCLALEKAQPEE